MTTATEEEERFCPSFVRYWLSRKQAHEAYILSLLLACDPQGGPKLHNTQKMELFCILSQTSFSIFHGTSLKLHTEYLKNYSLGYLRSHLVAKSQSQASFLPSHPLHNNMLLPRPQKFLPRRQTMQTILAFSLSPVYCFKIFSKQRWGSLAPAHSRDREGVQISLIINLFCLFQVNLDSL